MGSKDAFVVWVSVVLRPRGTVVRGTRAALVETGAAKGREQCARRRDGVPCQADGRGRPRDGDVRQRDE